MAEVGQVEHLQVGVVAPAEANAASLSTISDGEPARPLARRSARSRPIAPARRASSASSLPQQTTWAALNVIDAGRGLRAGLPDPAEQRLSLGDRLERRVELVRVAGREGRGAATPAAADDDRDLGRCTGLGSAGESVS